MKAIQEQQDIIENQYKRIEDLSTSLNKKDDALTTLSKRVKQIESIINTNGYEK